MVVVCCIGYCRFRPSPYRMGLFQALWGSSSCSRYLILFLVNSRISQAVETWYESLFRRIAESMPSLGFLRGKKRLVDEEEDGGFIDKIKHS